MALWLLFVVVTLSSAWPAFAQSGDHGVGHAHHHPWYSALKRPDHGGSCCSDNDCRPTTSRYDPQTGRWSAVKDGRWISIPPEKIVDTDVPAEAGSEAHLCAPPPTWSGFGRDEVFCFIRPNGGT